MTLGYLLTIALASQIGPGGQAPTSFMQTHQLQRERQHAAARAQVLQRQKALLATLSKSELQVLYDAVDHIQAEQAEQASRADKTMADFNAIKDDTQTNAAAKALDAQLVQGAKDEAALKAGVAPASFEKFKWPPSRVSALIQHDEDRVAKQVKVLENEFYSSIADPGEDSLLQTSGSGKLDGASLLENGQFKTKTQRRAEELQAEIEAANKNFDSDFEKGMAAGYKQFRGA